MRDLIAAIEGYSEDIRGSIIVEGIVSEDTYIDTKHTESTWEDGRPETKMFERNDEINLFLPKNTSIKGVQYVGRATGCTIFDFPYGRTWYSARDWDAEHLLEAIGHPVEHEDED